MDNENIGKIKTGAVIYASNYGNLSSFYEGITDLEVRESDKMSTILESESFQLVILQAPKHIADSFKISGKPERRESTPIKLVFYVENIDGVRDKVTSLGGKLDTSEKKWEIDNHRVCDGHDPEGNIFQLRAPTH